MTNATPLWAGLFKTGSLHEGGVGGTMRAGTRGKNDAMAFRARPVRTRAPAARMWGNDSAVAVFSFFLAGAAQAHAGQRIQTLLGDGVAAFAAAGHAVDPFRSAAIHGSARPHQGGLPVQAFQFGGLIKHVHHCLLVSCIAAVRRLQAK